MVSVGAGMGHNSVPPALWRLSDCVHGTAEVPDYWGWGPEPHRACWIRAFYVAHFPGGSIPYSHSLRGLQGTEYPYTYTLVSRTRLIRTLFRSLSRHFNT